MTETYITHSGLLIVVWQYSDTHYRVTMSGDRGQKILYDGPSEAAAKETFEAEKAHYEKQKASE